MSYAVATFVGRIGKIKAGISKKNNRWCFISIATKLYYNKKIKTTWHNDIVAFGKMAEFIEAHIQVGSEVMVRANITSTPRAQSKDNIGFIIIQIVPITWPKNGELEGEDIDKYEEPIPEEVMGETEYNSFEGDNKAASTETNQEDDLPF